MLVLSRKLNESIMIGDDVEFKILGMKRNEVKVGINAPKGIAVHRREVWERIKAEQSRPESEKLCTAGEACAAGGLVE